MFETRDVIIVASVSCIYGLGDPVDYQEMMLSLRPGMQKSRDAVMKKLINMQYTRNEIDFKRGSFRATGDILEIYPSSQSESAVRVEFWGDEIDSIRTFNIATQRSIKTLEKVKINPAHEYVLEENKEKNKWHIDTVLINRTILKQEGLKEENIIDSGLCSVCNSDIIHSFRVEKEGYGLETALIALK